jgi:hypothetical protein
VLRKYVESLLADEHRLLSDAERQQRKLPTLLSTNNVDARLTSVDDESILTAAPPQRAIL